MSFPYSKVAVFGATSGIGKALAERFIAHGIFVIAVGRRKDRLAELVHRYGHEKVQACPFDMMKLDGVPNFVTNVTSTHPDLDLVFLNSGVQYGHDFTQPEGVDFDKIKEEFTLNYLAPVLLTKTFLPFLSSRARDGRAAGILYTTSALGLVPMPTVPNYCATKAAMHSFILTLRAQLHAQNVRILELYPPAVQTELHGEGGKSFGMPLDEFTDAAWQGLTQGKEQIPVGMGEVAFNAFEAKRQEIFQSLVERLKEAPGVVRQ